jgi:hypothetical protein
MTPLENYFTSREYLVSGAVLIAGWTVVATATTVAKRLGLNVPAPSARQTLFVATALFVVLFYLPFGLGGVQLALGFPSALGLWLVLAPTLSLAFLVLAIASVGKRLAKGFVQKQPAAFNSFASLGLHLAIALMILVNCFWLAYFRL